MVGVTDTPTSVCRSSIWWRNMVECRDKGFGFNMEKLERPFFCVIPYGWYWAQSGWDGQTTASVLHKDINGRLPY